MQETSDLQLLEEIKTDYQIIRLYEDTNKKLVFTLDTYVQFKEGDDEEIYHYYLTDTLFLTNPIAQDFLILGGGDGLVARNILKKNPFAYITLVEIDKKVVEICMQNSRIRELNKNSLMKCYIEYADAKEWLKTSRNPFDIIILDLPDGNSEELKQLYNYEFYKNCINLMKIDGIISIQTHLSVAKDVITKLTKLGLTIKELPYSMPWMGEGIIIQGQYAKN